MVASRYRKGIAIGKSCRAGSAIQLFRKKGKRIKLMAKNYTMDTIVSLAKSRGFVYPGSEIYGGITETWVWS